jgi:hypothetical protein
LVFVLTTCGFAGAQEAPKSDAAADKSAKADSESAKPDGVREITFEDIKFEIAKGEKFEREMLGEKIENLAGKQVRIKGYFLPGSVFQTEVIKQFVLVFDDKNCDAFSLAKTPIRVVMEEGLTTKFSTKPITVEGEFEIHEWAIIDGRPMAVYHITAKSVK